VQEPDLREYKPDYTPIYKTVPSAVILKEHPVGYIGEDGILEYQLTSSYIFIFYKKLAKRARKVRSRS
jgi:hypothetical protein